MHDRVSRGREGGRIRTTLPSATTVRNEEPRRRPGHRPRAARRPASWHPRVLIAPLSPPSGGDAVGAGRREAPETGRRIQGYRRARRGGRHGRGSRVGGRGFRDSGQARAIELIALAASRGGYSRGSRFKWDFGERTRCYHPFSCSKCYY